MLRLLAVLMSTLMLVQSAFAHNASNTNFESISRVEVQRLLDDGEISQDQIVQVSEQRLRDLMSGRNSESTEEMQTASVADLLFLCAGFAGTGLGLYCVIKNGKPKASSSGVKDNSPDLGSGIQ